MSTLFQLFYSAQYSECTKQLTQALGNAETMQERIALLCNRAIAYRFLKLFKHCLKDCTDVLALDPTCCRAYSQAVAALVGRGLRAEAQAMFQKALENCPLGDILMFKEMKDALEGVAVEEVKVHVTSSPLQAAKVAQVRPIHSHQATQGEVTRLGIGAFQVNTRNYDEAIRTYTSLLRDNPCLVEARAGLGSAYAMLSRFEDAILTFVSLVEIDPGNVDGWIRLAQTRCASGHVVQAKLDLDKAISLDNQSSLAFLERGMALKRLGDEPTALLDLQAGNVFPFHDSMH